MLSTIRWDDNLRVSFFEDAVVRVSSSKDILVNCCCAGHFIAAVALGWVF